MKTWLEWWNAYRYHLIPAFQGFNIPGVTLAEIGPSALRNDHPMMLIDKAYLDDTSMFIQNKQYKEFKNNTTNGCGHGPKQRKTAENSRMAQERRGKIYAENHLGHCQVQGIDEEQDDEEEIREINDTNDDDDGMDGGKMPTSKSGHKVPKTFKKKNPTKTFKIRKRKFPKGNGDDQRSKVEKKTHL